MGDPALRQEIERFVQEINELKCYLPKDWELVLELEKDNEAGEYICSYYFVSHSDRCLFWLHELDLESVLGNVAGVTEKAHIRKTPPVLDIHRTKHISRSSIAGSVLVSGFQDVVPMTSRLTILRYHWEMFPHNRVVPDDLFHELCGMLLHAGVGTSGPVLDAA